MHLSPTALRTLAPALLAAITFVGCDDEEETGAPITAEQARPQAQANTRQALDATGDVLQQFRAAAANLDEGRGEALRALLSAMDEAACGDRISDIEGPVEEGCALDAEIMGELADGVDEMLEALIEKATLESDSGRRLVYRLGPDIMCEPEVVRAPVPAGESGEPEIISEAPDEGCVELFTKVPVRIVMTSPRADDVDLALQIGQGGHQPLGVSFHQDRVAGWVSLDTIIPIAEEIGEALGEPIQVPLSLSGRVEAALEHEAHAFSLSVSTPTGVEIRSVAQATPGTRQSAEVPEVKITVAAGTAVRATLDGDRVEARLSLAGGAIEVDMPGDLDALLGGEGASVVCDSEGNCEDVELGGDAPERIVARVGGFSGEIIARLADDVVDASNLTIRPWAMEIDGETAMEMVLNPEHDHTLSANMKALDEGGVEIAVAPAFDLKLTVDPQALERLDGAEDEVFGEEAPEAEAGPEGPQWVALELSGAEQPRVRLLDTFEAGQLQVVEGTLTLDASMSEAALVVEAGMCLSELEAEVSAEAGEAPFSGLEVAACE